MPSNEPEWLKNAPEADDEPDWLKAAPVAEREITPVESAAVGAGQSVVLGFGDEIGGAVLGAKDYLQGKGYNYRDRQKEIEEYIEKTRETNPKSYLGGAVAGAVGTALIPGLNVIAPAKGASVAANAGRMAAGGALAGIGESKGNFDTARGTTDVAKSALLGGLIGGATQGISQKGGDILESFAPSNLRKFASERAYKAGTGQNKRAIKEAVKSGQLYDKGQALMQADEAGPPVVGYFSKAENIEMPAKEKMQFFGKKIGDVGKQIDAAMPNSVSGQEIAENIYKHAYTIPDTGTNQSVIDDLIEEADRYQKIGNMSFEKAQHMKGGYSWNASRDDVERIAAQNAKKMAVGQAMDNAADRISKIASESGDSNLSDLTSKYGYYKGKYGAHADIADAAEERYISNLSNRAVSPSDYGMGLGVGAGELAKGADPTGAAQLGMIAGISNKLARERGSAFAGRSANALAGILEKSPEAAQRMSSMATKAATSGGTQLGLQQLIEEFVNSRRSNRP